VASLEVDPQHKLHLAVGPGSDAPVATNEATYIRRYNLSQWIVKRLSDGFSYHNNFKPNCSCRGEFACDVI
jgi:hypothetical protein